eukprot:4232376-Pleurochrysis_carterae.AAC.1
MQTSCWPVEQRRAPPRAAGRRRCLQQVAAAAVLHDEVVLCGALDPSVEPHDVHVAQLRPGVRTASGKKLKREERRLSRRDSEWVDVC